MQTTSKRIEVVVRPDGQSSVETKGFAGAECEEASRFLEAALGSSEGDQRTAEFYSTAVAADAGVSNSNSGRKEGL
mgnify:CR=1 FL=1